MTLYSICFCLQVSFKLFLSVTRLFGQDLISVDINRGRDQGVATYVQVRDACGLCPVNTFDDLAPLISNPTTVSTHYLEIPSEPSSRYVVWLF